ncbi:hypothetical protein [Mucilaginibacter lappiensis]|uniref:hypothetical protein n=1 Tax=Mucilaginibacter lappiensis TaxID=354630 RepID=UPI003D1B9948
MNWLKKLLNAITPENKLKIENETEQEKPKEEDTPQPEKPTVIRPTLYDCIHESGHYLVSLLFPNEIRINSLNLDKSQFKSEWNGQLHITRTTPYESTDDSEKLMLIFCAGMVATTIFSHGKSYVLANLSNFPRNPAMMHTNGGDDDNIAIRNLSATVGRDARFHLQGRWVMWNGYQAIFNYLMEPAVWSSVELIAQTLFESDAFKMSHDEIQALLADHGKLEELNGPTAAFLAARYPLTKTKLSQMI